MTIWNLDILNKIDWPELSKIIAAVVIGGYISHILTLKREREKTKRDVLVTCAIAVTAIPTLNLDDDIVELISIRAVNHGQRPVNIVGAGIIFRNESTFTQLATPVGPRALPKKLKDGDYVTIFLEFPKLVDAMKIHNTFAISAYASDSTGKVFTTPIPSNLKEMLESLLRLN